MSCSPSDLCRQNALSASNFGTAGDSWEMTSRSCVVNSAVAPVDTETAAEDDEVGFRRRSAKTYPVLIATMRRAPTIACGARDGTPAHLEPAPIPNATM